MKKILILLTLSILFVSCDSNSERINNKIELFKQPSHLSSLNYNIEIKKYLIKHRTNEISVDVLDSLLVLSDTKCDSIITDIVKKNY